MQPLFEALVFELISLDLFFSLGKSKMAKQQQSLNKRDIPQGYRIKPEVKNVLIISFHLCISLSSLLALISPITATELPDEKKIKN